MPPQHPTMSASVRGFSEEGFDRESLKISRQNAPSFSNGRLRANKFVMVVFPRHANKTILCHADVLRFWSPRLRTLIDGSEVALQDTKRANLRNGTMPMLAVNGPLENLSTAAITLRDVQPQTFAIFLDWAYSGRLPATKPLLTTPAPADTDELESNASFYYRQPEAKFLEAYIFGRRYHIRDFRNDTFDCLYEIINWRKVGKEGDPSGSLMPSLLVCSRAMETLLQYDDPATYFLSRLFYHYLPNAIQSAREKDCATELEEEWGIPIRNKTKGDEVRDGLCWHRNVKKEQERYCERYHEHLGDESTQCWTMQNPTDDTIKEEEDASSTMNRNEEDGETVDCGNSTLDEDTDEADNSMDEHEENENDEDELELAESKYFNIWGSDEPTSEDWDDDYEYSSSVEGSEEFEEDEDEEDEGEEKEKENSEQLDSLSKPHQSRAHFPLFNTASVAERYQYAL